MIVKMNNKFSIEVTDNDDWRYERLHIVIGYLYAMDSSSVDMIDGIKDEKGYLMVNWKKQPLPSMIENCKDIWCSPLCNEPSENIEHYVNGKKI